MAEPADADDQAEIRHLMREHKAVTTFVCARLDAGAEVKALLCALACALGHAAADAGPAANDESLIDLVCHTVREAHDNKLARRTPPGPVGHG